MVEIPPPSRVIQPHLHDDPCDRTGYDAYAVIDASGTFSETKRITGLLRMVQAGVAVTDYSTVAVEMLKDNASRKAGALYAALDMPFAGLVGQLAGAFAKGRAA